jgi:hypothetical protein
MRLLLRPCPFVVARIPVVGEVVRHSSLLGMPVVVAVAAKDRQEKGVADKHTTISINNLLLLLT